MTILSQLQNSGHGLPQLVQGFFKDDRLYRYLNVYPLKGLSEGSVICANRQPERVPPVHRLPVELLAEVFRQYVQTVDHSRPSRSLCTQPHSQMTPFPLGQVCYYWRSIVLAMGDLWQSLFISPPKMEHIPSVEMWLSRAGEYPLSIWLFQSQRPSDQELLATDEILSLLVTRFHRWKEITVQLSAVVHQALLNLPHGAAVCLEAARMDVRDWDFTSADNLWRALHSSPRLCRPEWVNRYRNGPPNHAPWAQLTHITLAGLVSVDVVLNILQYCTRAVNVTVPHLVSPRMPSQISPFVLTQLRSICICTDTELGSLFQNLILPGLVSLDLTYRREAYDLSSSLHLADLLCRSRCRLRTLVLYAHTKKTITEYLRIPALETLIELRLDNQVSDETIRLFSKDSGAEQLLPRLQRMTLTCCASDGTLSAMVVSRLPTLQTIRVALCRNTHSYCRDLAILYNMQKNGYDIEVDVL